MVLTLVSSSVSEDIGWKGIINIKILSFTEPGFGIIRYCLVVYFQQIAVRQIYYYIPIIIYLILLHLAFFSIRIKAKQQQIILLCFLIVLSFYYFYQLYLFFIGLFSIKN